MRVLIYGAPGAGKTSVALALSDRFDVPVHHLDAVFFNSDGTPRSRETSANKAAQLAAGERWIIEGNHGAALDAIAARADRIVLLKIGPMHGLLRQIKRRFWTPRRLAKTGPGGGPPTLPLHLVRYTLWVHPQLEPHHIAKIKNAATGDVRAFSRTKHAIAWLTETERT